VLESEISEQIAEEAARAGVTIEFARQQGALQSGCSAAG
jgi:hypothetical protein